MFRVYGYFLFLFSLITGLAFTSFLVSGCTPNTNFVVTITVPDTNWADTNVGYAFNSNTSGVYSNLVWSDEFNDTDYGSANPANWVYETGNNGGWGNSEKEYYLSQNGYIYKGTLVIKAQKENYGGQSYTSARLKTYGLQSFTYGKIAARIQLPAGQGFWPAFWMLGTNIATASWPGCGENDIMENKGSSAVISASTLIFPTNSATCYLSQNYTSGNLNTSYHVFELIWTLSNMQYFVDGTLTHTVTSNNVTNVLGSWAIFQKPFFIILNLAVGGNYGGNPDGTTPFPSYMFIDWVRVYQ